MSELFEYVGTIVVLGGDKKALRAKIRLSERSELRIFASATDKAFALTIFVKVPHRSPRSPFFVTVPHRSIHKSVCFAAVAALRLSFYFISRALRS